MTAAIIKYDAGNVQSVQFALDRLGVSSIITDDHAAIQSADKVIFPGVGHAAPAMAYLRERKLDEVILSLQQPVLGICLGMQLMCAHSEEGNTECLGVFDVAVKRFANPTLKIPQVGWNSLEDCKGFLTGLPEASFVYTVHSYYAEMHSQTIAAMQYGIRFSAALQQHNFYAAQFHPEKSGAVGEQILQQFIQLP